MVDWREQARLWHQKLLSSNHLWSSEVECGQIICFKFFVVAIFFPSETGSLEFYVRSPNFLKVLHFLIQIINKTQ